MTSQFTIPNVADALNSNQAEIDKVDIDILVAGYERTGVLSGTAVTAQAPQTLTVDIAAGVIIVAGVRASVSGTTTTHTAPGTVPRFDLVVSDSSGTISVVEGVGATQPVFPAVPASSVALAAIYFPESLSTIGSNQITDKRVIVGSFGDNIKREYGDNNDVQQYWDGSDFVTLISGAIRHKYRPGAFAFQEATVISTTAGSIMLSPAGFTIATTTFRINDNIGLAFGSSSDTFMLNRSTVLSADGGIATVIVGAPDHQGIAANSLVVSNATDDGDMMFLVSVGGNSKEFLLADADVATLSLGHGMLKTKFKAASTVLIEGDGTGLGFFATAPAAQPTGVAVSAAGIHAALVTLGLITA